MQKQVLLFVLFTITLFGFQCNAQGILNTEKIEEIDTFLKLQTKKGFSGSVLISENNNILLSKGYGFANRELKTLNSAGTFCRLWRLSALDGILHSIPASGDAIFESPPRINQTFQMAISGISIS